MKNLNTLLQDADPVRYEGTTPRDTLVRQRQALLTKAQAMDRILPDRHGRRYALLAAAALTVITAALFFPGLRPLFVAEVHAAVQFEVRLAEDQPSPGRQEAKVIGADRTVFLSGDIVVTNGDILRAEVVPGSDPSHFGVSVEFTPAGAQKMKAATEKHIGKRMAILLDGKVVMAPTLRSSIGSVAVITGKFSKAEAERIAAGLK